MGTPHTSEGSDEASLIAYNKVLYDCVKVSRQKQTARLSRHDAIQLANLAARFEQIATVRILSVFEKTDPALSGKGLFAKKNRVCQCICWMIAHCKSRHWLINVWQVSLRILRRRLEFNYPTNSFANCLS